MLFNILSCFLDKARLCQCVYMYFSLNSKCCVVCVCLNLQILKIEFCKLHLGHKGLTFEQKK